MLKVCAVDRFKGALGVAGGAAVVPDADLFDQWAKSLTEKKPVTVGVGDDDVF